MANNRAAKSGFAAEAQRKVSYNTDSKNNSKNNCIHSDILCNLKNSG